MRTDTEFPMRTVERIEHPSISAEMAATRRADSSLFIMNFVPRRLGIIKIMFDLTLPFSSRNIDISPLLDKDFGLDNHGRSG